MKRYYRGHIIVQNVDHMRITPEILKSMGFEQLPYEGSNLLVWELHLKGYRFFITNRGGLDWFFGNNHIIRHVEDMLPLIAKDSYEDGYEDGRK
jgi:hypothetical protein